MIYERPMRYRRFVASILRARLIRFGRLSTPSLMSTGELAVTIGVPFQNMAEVLSKMRADGMVVRVRHGFYRAPSEFPLSVQEGTAPTDRTGAASAPHSDRCTAR